MIFVFSVDEIEGKVDTDNDEIEDVQCEGVVDVTADDFTENPGDVADQDSGNKNNAFSTCGF